MKVQAVVFDMDGVLLDSETICDESWKLAAKEYNIDPTQIIRKCLGTNRQDTIRIISEECGKDFPAEEYLNRANEKFHEIEFSSGIPLMPFVKETLEYLKSRYRLCVASSTRKESVVRQLTNAGIIGYFETLTTGDMVVHSKPDPEIYLLACKSIAMPVSDCVAVEDSPNGIKSAFAAGLKTIMVPDKVQPAEDLMPKITKLCKTLDDLKSFL